MRRRRHMGRQAPTLALSQRERKLRARRLHNSVRSLWPILPLSSPGPLWSPLPLGEGWGEGRRPRRLTERPSPRRAVYWAASPLRSARLAWWGIALAIITVFLTACGGLPELHGEGSPPGYISGDIPKQYQDLRSPFSLEDQQALTAGQGLYQANCAVCHGDNGRGDGPKATYLEPAPADFAAPVVLSAFRDHQDYVFWWVSEGVRQTGMPAWRDKFSDQERWQVITYAWSLGEQAARQQANSRIWITMLRASQCDIPR